jgi:hypothetical protein
LVLLSSRAFDSLTIVVGSYPGRNSIKANKNITNELSRNLQGKLVAQGLNLAVNLADSLLFLCNHVQLKTVMLLSLFFYLCCIYASC